MSQTFGKVERFGFHVEGANGSMCNSIVVGLLDPEQKEQQVILHVERDHETGNDVLVIQTTNARPLVVRPVAGNAVGVEVKP